MQTRRVIKIGGSYGITLPKDMMIALGLRPGGYVDLEINTYLRRPTILLKNRDTRPLDRVHHSPPKTP
jgi:antitoxin component of MazEF toxin-antitoxin module